MPILRGRRDVTRRCVTGWCADFQNVAVNPLQKLVSSPDIIGVLLVPNFNISIYKASGYRSNLHRRAEFITEFVAGNSSCHRGK